MGSAPHHSQQQFLLIIRYKGNCEKSPSDIKWKEGVKVMELCTNVHRQQQTISHLLHVAWKTLMILSAVLVFTDPGANDLCVSPAI